MSWYDDMREFVALGREAHRGRKWLLIAVWWLGALLITACFAAIARFVWWVAA